MTAEETKDDGTEEYEVVELESDDGEIEEFVIIDRIEIENVTYAIMAVLEDVENMEKMTEEEYATFFKDEDVFILMKQDGDDFLELDDAEYEGIKDRLDKELENRGL